MAVDFEEFGTEELGIPSLTARRIKQPDGSLRVMIAVAPVKWDKELKRPRVTSSKNVGVVANNKEFGPIVFRDAFLKQYPQLRKVTVLRKESHKYVYIKTPFKLDADTVGYHKVGRKRYSPPPSEGQVKLYGSTMLCSKVAEYFPIKQSLFDVFGKHMSTTILALAIALIVFRHNCLRFVERAADYLFLSTEKLPLSSPAITKLCKAITSGLGQRYFGLFTTRLYKLFPSLEGTLYAVDGSALPSYAKTNPTADYGHAKKDNPGIPQINLIFIAHMITGIPCYFRDLTGNVPDKSAYKNDSDYCCAMLEKAATMRDVLGLKVQMTHVFDRGYSTMRVMKCAVEHEFDFVCCMTSSMKDTKEAKAYAAIHKIEKNGTIIGDTIRHMAVPKHACPTITSTTTGQQKRLLLHIYYDQCKEAEEHTRLIKIGISIIAAHKSETYDALSKKIRDLDKRIKLVHKNADGEWCIDSDAVMKEAASVARRVLGTTREDFDGLRVLSTYKNREKVELAFRSFKGLGFDRVGSGNIATQFGRLFIFFISCQIEMGLLYLSQQAKEGKNEREPLPQEKSVLNSVPELFNLMNGITCQVCGKNIKVHEITSLRRRVLELLGFPVVTASDEDADDESLLFANLTSQALAELYTPQDASEEGLRIK